MIKCSPTKGRAEKVQGCGGSSVMIMHTTPSLLQCVYGWSFDGNNDGPEVGTKAAGACGISMTNMSLDMLD